jgi:hypothetical protein
MSFPVLRIFRMFTDVQVYTDEIVKDLSNNAFMKARRVFTFRKKRPFRCLIILIQSL